MTHPSGWRHPDGLTAAAWAPGAAGTDPEATDAEIEADGTEQTVTIYGRIAPGLTVPSGTYGDAVTATLNF